MTPLRTVEQVADLLAVNTHTVYRLIRSHQLQAVRVGKAIRISDADLDAYLSRQRTGQSFIRKVPA